jgi:hypothetical protein
MKLAAVQAGECELISRAELEMHGIARFSCPVASPFKSGSAKYCDHRRIHVPGSSLLITLRIEVDSYSPSMGGKLGPGALRAKRKAAAETGYFVLQSAALNLAEYIAENASQRLVASNRANVLRVVPGYCQRKWQRDTREELCLPGGIQGVIFGDVAEDVAESDADFVQSAWRQKRNGRGFAR